MKLHALTITAAFALAGQWVTTESGDRVCRLSASLSMYNTLTPSFCEDWQPGFTKPLYGQLIPFEQGWARRLPGSQTLQLHIEDKWVP